MKAWLWLPFLASVVACGGTAQCAVIDFACPANTTLFQNPCGCGCEQGFGCPDWFDCMPGPGQSCDTNQIKTQCPYSGIAF